MSDTNVIKILLIEDNPGDARLIREALSMTGEPTEVQCTDRLAKGLEMLERGRFDAVLLDLSLPDSRGFSTFEQLRRRAPRVPVVVLTGLDDEELALRAVREGAQDYLVKGAVKSSTILRIVRFAVERNRVMDSVRSGDSGQAPGKCIGFMGVRGGSGATTVALNTAAALVRQGKSVVAIELSPYRSGFSLQLRLTPRRDLANLTKLDAEHINARELRNCLVESEFGVSLLFAPQDPSDALKLDPERAAAVLRAAASLAKFVIVDLPSVPSAVHQVCARMCDPLLLVMEREATGLAAAKSLVSLLQFWGLEKGSLAGVLITKDPMSACVSPVQVRSELGIPMAGVIPPAAEAVTASCRRGSPLVAADQDTLPAESLMRLAERLTAPVLTEVAD
jgi:CheY-like chemotaxis protein/MinD-like ATPase involved in chromosome partitioning or flagellar assembly